MRWYEYVFSLVLSIKAFSLPAKLHVPFVVPSNSLVSLNLEIGYKGVAEPQGTKSLPTPTHPTDHPPLPASPSSAKTKALAILFRAKFLQIRKSNTARPFLAYSQTYKTTVQLNTAKLFASTFRRTLRSSAGLSIVAATSATVKNNTTANASTEFGARKMHSKVVSTYTASGSFFHRV